MVLFRQVTRAIGPDLVAKLWLAHRKEGRLDVRDPRAFASFLAKQEIGRQHPALADLARLDLAWFLAGLEDREPSIGTCCLPINLIEGHPELMLRLQPSFRYLSLAYLVHEWVVGAGGLPGEPADRPAHLRISPDHSIEGADIRCEMLSPARFAFESAIARGRTLVAATKMAVAHDPMFSGLKALAALIDEGAIADVILHAKP